MHPCTSTESNKKHKETNANPKRSITHLRESMQIYKHREKTFRKSMHPCTSTEIYKKLIGYPCKSTTLNNKLNGIHANLRKLNEQLKGNPCIHATPQKSIKSKRRSMQIHNTQ